jgi:Arm domain-containing DNA-binding protein
MTSSLQAIRDLGSSRALKAADRRARPQPSPSGEEAGRPLDTKVRGFGVRVSPQGTKSFFVWYRVGDDARRLTLGRYPTMSLAEGRKRAQQALLEVASGKDPAAEKQRARAAYSGELFGALLEDFIENHAKRKTRLWGDTERLLNREFVSHWEKWPAGHLAAGRHERA